MYCPVCGVDNQQGMRFCKRCGATMSLPATKPHSDITPGKLTGMFWAIAVLALGGLGVILGCMIPLMVLGMGRVLLAIVSFLGFVTVFGIAGLLIKQLSRLINLVEANPVQSTNASTAAEYARPQIPAPPRAVSSVTEHTTRNFDRVYEEQRTRE